MNYTMIEAMSQCEIRVKSDDSNALNPVDAPEKGIAMADLTYKLRRLSDYPVIPSTERLIDPYLPLGGQIVLAALPKTFKTFIALSWCCCVVTGHPWLDHPVKKGKVLYIALESYHGVLRRKEAWRKKHDYSKADLNNFACITVPINFAQAGSIGQPLADLAAQGFRPDLIVIDTWFKSTAGAKVSDQAEMTAALEQLTIFQKTLGAVIEFKDALPQVTVLIIAHTDKEGVDLFGSVTQFANCDVLYMLKREAHTFEATLSCMGANGPQNLAVISGTVAAVKKSSKKDDDLTAMETVLELTLGSGACRTPKRLVTLAR